MKPLWIMVAGPYRGTTSDRDKWASNHRCLNEYAIQILRMGHIPIIGVNAALPIIDAAGEAAFNEVMMSVSLALAERCDAVLRIGGSSTGADAEVSIFKDKGLPVFYRLEDIPIVKK